MGKSTTTQYQAQLLPRALTSLRQVLSPAMAGAFFVFAWAASARLVAADYLLPSPLQVAASANLHRARLIQHAATTLSEVAGGLLLGTTVALALGYVIYRSPVLERVLMPYVVASQAVPIVAVAPLLIVWLGPGFAVKMATAAVIVFFPMLINTVVGFRNIPREYRELMRSFSATSFQTLRYLEVPAALPVLLAGLRVAVTLSVIGAVVGEFLGSARGLGALIVIARGQYNIALMYAAVLSLVVLSLSLYGAAAVVEERLLAGRGDTSVA